MSRTRSLVLLLVLTACGTGFEGGGGDSDGGAGRVDGIALQDASGCPIYPTIQPTTVTPGTTVRVTATDPGVGLGDFTWHVDGPSGAVDFIVVSVDGSQIEFLADEAGAWNVSVQALGTCTGSAGFQVVPAGAFGARYQLRYLPPDGTVAPPQDDPAPVDILGGGATWVIGDRRLAGGRRATASLVDDAGLAISAWVRFLPSSGGPPVETIAVAGALDALVVAGTHDLLIAPYVGAAPRRFPSIAPGDLTPTIVLRAGELVTGTVVASGGGSIAGAIVATTTGAMPAQLATTDAAGAYQVRVDLPAGPLGLRVEAPAGRASCTLDPIALPAPDAPIAITLAAAAVRSIGGTARGPDDAPLAGARVTAVATALPACDVTVGGTPHAGRSSARASALTAADGTFGPLAVPAGSYDLIIEPPAGAPSGPARQALDVTAADAPAITARAAALEPRAVTVVDPAGAGVARTRVVFAPAPLHGLLSAWRVTVDTDAAGAATALLPAGLAFDVELDPPRARRTLAPTTSTLPIGGAAAFTLPAGITVEGTLLYPLGGGQPGVRIEAFCEACPTRRRVASTATGPGGAFILRLPDPGVAAPP